MSLIMTTVRAIAEKGLPMFGIARGILRHAGFQKGHALSVGQLRKYGKLVKAPLMIEARDRGLKDTGSKKEVLDRLERSDSGELTLEDLVTDHELVAAYDTGELKASELSIEAMRAMLSEIVPDFPFRSTWVRATTKRRACVSCASSRRSQ